MESARPSTTCTASSADFDVNSRDRACLAPGNPDAYLNKRKACVRREREGRRRDRRRPDRRTEGRDNSVQLCPVYIENGGATRTIGSTCGRAQTPQESTSCTYGAKSWCVEAARACVGPAGQTRGVLHCCHRNHCNHTFCNNNPKQLAQPTGTPTPHTPPPRPETRVMTITQQPQPQQQRSSCSLTRTARRTTKAFRRKHVPSSRRPHRGQRRGQGRGHKTSRRRFPCTRWAILMHAPPPRPER